MPIHEYRCDLCGERVEFLLRAGEPDPETCGDACALGMGSPGRGRLVRVMSVPAPPRVGAASADLPVCGRCGREGGGCA